MANHKSAIKRARQSLRRNAINSRTLAGIRTSERKLRAAILKKDKKTAEQLLVTYMSVAGKAAQKGRVRSQTAGRKIGRLSKQIAAL